MNLQEVKSSIQLELLYKILSCIYNDELETLFATENYRDIHALVKSMVVYDMIFYTVDNRLLLTSIGRDVLFNRSLF